MAKSEPLYVSGGYETMLVCNIRPSDGAGLQRRVRVMTKGAQTGGLEVIIQIEDMAGMTRKALLHAIWLPEELGEFVDG